MKFKDTFPALTLLTLLVLPGLGEAQQGAWTVQQDRGWIGIRVNYTATFEGNQEKTVVIIEEVENGSPAEASGILPGDTITLLDGKPYSHRIFTNLTQTLKPGDLVRLTLLREGRTREVLVEAGSWPARGMLIFRPEEYGEIVIKMDTIQKAIMDELDQMRLRIGELHLDSAPSHLTFSVVRRAPTEGEGQMTITYRFDSTPDSLSLFSRDLHFVPDFPQPFEAFVVQSDAIRRVREDQMRVRDALTDVRRLERIRIDELRTLSPTLTAEALEQDERVRELRAREEQLLEEQEVLIQRLNQVSEEEMARRAVEMQAQQEAALAQALSGREQTRARVEFGLRAREAAEAAYTYSRLMAAGTGLVAGAEVEPLNPKLAQYFHVDGGVLVLDVLEGTPAADADLQGGDVIITVAGDSVSSVEDLKFGLAYLGRPLRLRVIRNGEPLEVVIRK